MRTLSVLSDLSPAIVTASSMGGTPQGGEPAYWELGDGGVVLRDGVLYVLNVTARALWASLVAGSSDESAVDAIAEQWHTDPETVREECLTVLSQLRQVTAVVDAA